MTTEDTLTKTRQAFHEAFHVDAESVSLDTRPEDVKGWDSLGQLALASGLEQAFGIDLTVDDLMEMENVHAIIRIVQSKLEP